LGEEWDLGKSAQARPVNTDSDAARNGLRFVYSCLPIQVAHPRLDRHEEEL